MIFFVCGVLTLSFDQFADYQNYVVNGCVKENPAMERSIALCNGISQWVQLMVLSRPTAQLRAEVFTKFINVAQVRGLGAIYIPIFIFKILFMLRNI